MFLPFGAGESALRLIFCFKRRRRVIAPLATLLPKENPAEVTANLSLRYERLGLDLDRPERTRAGIHLITYV